MDIKIDILDSSNINAIVKQLSTIEQINEESEVNIQLNYTCGKFLQGEIFAVIVAYVKYLERLGKVVKLIYEPDEECETIKYAARINFFKLLGISFNEKFTRHDPSGRFVEITQFESDDTLFDVVHQVTTIFKTHLGLDENTLNSLYYCFSEVVGNVHIHAKSENGGLAYAQYFKGTNTLKIFIIDSGIGIHKSLTESVKYKTLTPEQALLKSIEKGVTDGKGMGKGLYHTSQFLLKTLGLITINSCGKELRKSAGIPKGEVKDISFWQGTIISMIIRTDQKADFKGLFEGDPPALTFEESEECRNEKENVVKQ
jgi:hypothetical protein